MAAGMLPVKLLAQRLRELSSDAVIGKIKKYEILKVRNKRWDRSRDVLVIKKESSDGVIGAGHFGPSAMRGVRWGPMVERRWITPVLIQS
ncbi:unnamed protein product [Dovyalis caffra]|uniref:Ribosomal protein S12 n=1 Tax=Dovyalis caffra TaxID=77055 RepID=A0AAV1RPQ0_9ROSI|nr:unnamed protein product [Dovyalis caffra]